MSIEPLLSAEHPIPLHGLAAMAAFALGIVQFARREGTPSHRMIGWI